MARPSIPVDVIGNTAQLRKQIEELSKTPVILNVQSAGGRGGAKGLQQQASAISNIGTGLAAGSAAASSFNRPLGKISGNLSEIDKSLGAANARVIAFGASAGAIFAVQNAVQQLFASFVNTEKKLAEINTVLNLDQGTLKSFGKQVFKTAGQTGQSFDTAAEAALEFSRQGLGVEETTKRTRDALILSRLSGLDAASSVEALTASVNSYRKSGLTTGQVVNKLANVDAGFAVSSADLAEALSRVGSSAQDAGISFDELIALVTSAQQITSRGGAVIGNSLKTIFTRLGRTETREMLGGMGISLVDEQGNEKNQIALLKDLAGVYETLGTEQKNAVAEQVGGVFQLNILKAALSDLGRSYSVYDRALNTSLGSTNQAEKRNEDLNKTLAGLGAQTAASVQSAAGTIGEGLFAPAAKNVLNIADFLATSVNESDSSGVGSQLGKGIVNGLGSFLAGPGLAIVGAVLAKLFGDFAKYGATAAQSLLGLDKTAKNQAAIQQSVGAFLQKNAGLYTSIVGGQTSATAAAKQYLQVINQQTAALQAQAAIVKSVSAAVVSSVGKSAGPVAGPAPISGRKARFAGFIPNFAAMSERDYYQSVENVGADSHKAGYRASILKGVTVHDGLGNSERAWMTSRESRETFTNEAGYKATIITPPNGFGPNTMVASAGFIPNFAKKEKKQKRTVGGLNFGWLHAGNGYGTSNITAWDKRDGTEINASWGYSGLKKKINFEDDVIKDFTPPFQKLVNRIAPTPTSVGTINQYMDKSAWPQFIGRAFESAVIGAVYGMADVSGEGGGKGFDVPSVDQMKFGEVFENVGGFTTADIKKSPPGDKPSAADPNVSSFINKLMTRAGYGGGYKNNLSNVPPDKETLKSNKDKALAKQAMIASQNNVTAKQEAEYMSQRKAALDRIQKEGVILTKKELEKRLESEIGPNLNTLRNKQQSALRRPGKYSGFIPHFAPNIAAIQKLITQGATSGERQAAIAAMQRIQSGALSKLGSADKLAKFRELLYGSKSNAGFNLDAIKIKDFKYGPLVAGAKELGLTMKDLEMLSANPMAINQLRAFQAGTKSDYFSAGFIPNFASQIKEMQDRALRTERSYGEGAELRQTKYKGKLMTYAAQPGQSSNFNTMMKQDHPEGFKAAVQNSAAAQGLSRGFIPNFAPEDDSSAQSAAIAASIQSLLFTLAFSLPQRGTIAEGIKEEKIKNAKAYNEIRAQNLKSEAQRRFEQKKAEAKRLKQSILNERKSGAITQRQAIARFGAINKTLNAANENLQKRFTSIDKNLASSSERLVTNNKYLDRVNQQVLKQQGGYLAGLKQQAKGIAGSQLFKTPGAGIGIALAAPILAETIAGGLGKETTGGRTVSAAGQGLGFLAAGAAIGGVPGAVVGGAIGAGLMFKEYVEASTSKEASSIKKLEEASAEATKTADLAASAQSIASDYYQSLADSGPDSKRTKGLRKDIYNVISKFGSEKTFSLAKAFEEGSESFQKELDKQVKEKQANEETAKKVAELAPLEAASRRRGTSVFGTLEEQAKFLSSFYTGGDFVEFKASDGFLEPKEVEQAGQTLSQAAFGGTGEDFIKNIDEAGGAGKIVTFFRESQDAAKKFREEAEKVSGGLDLIEGKGNLEAANQIEKGALIGAAKVDGSGLRANLEPLKKAAKEFKDINEKQIKEFINLLDNPNIDKEQKDLITALLANTGIQESFTADIAKRIIEARKVISEQERAIEDGGAPARGKKEANLKLARTKAYFERGGEGFADIISASQQKKLSKLESQRIDPNVPTTEEEREVERQNKINKSQRRIDVLRQYGIKAPMSDLNNIISEAYSARMEELKYLGLENIPGLSQQVYDNIRTEVLTAGGRDPEEDLNKRMQELQGRREKNPAYQQAVSDIRNSTYERAGIYFEDTDNNGTEEARIKIKDVEAGKKALGERKAQLSEELKIQEEAQRLMSSEQGLTVAGAFSKIARDRQQQGLALGDPKGWSGDTRKNAEKLQREMEFATKAANYATENASFDYQDLTSSTETKNTERDQIVRTLKAIESASPVVEKAPQDMGLTVTSPLLNGIPKSQQAATPAPAPTPEPAQPEKLSPAQDVSGKVLEAARLNSIVEKALGTSLQDPATNPFLAGSMELPAVLDPQGSSGAGFRFSEAQVEFYGGAERDVSTIFNEATHVGQYAGKKDGQTLSERMREVGQSVGESGFKEKAESLRKMADFLQEQNESAQTQFTEIGKFTDSPDSFVRSAFAASPFKDDRKFDKIISEYSAISSNDDMMRGQYLSERSSTLNGILAKGVSKGEITSDELVGGLGFTKENAESYVAGINKVQQSINSLDTLNALKESDASSVVRSATTEGSIPDKSYLMGRPRKATQMEKDIISKIPVPVSQTLKGIGGVAGRFAGPAGLAYSAYGFMDNFGGLPWSDKSKKPKEMSPKDMPDYLKEYRTGPQPKFSSFGPLVGANGIEDGFQNSLKEFSNMGLVKPTSGPTTEPALPLKEFSNMGLAKPTPEQVNTQPQQLASIASLISPMLGGLISAGSATIGQLTTSAETAAKQPTVSSQETTVNNFDQLASSVSTLSQSMLALDAAIKSLNSSLPNQQNPEQNNNQQNPNNQPANQPSDNSITLNLEGKIPEPKIEVASVNIDVSSLESIDGKLGQIESAINGGLAQLRQKIVQVENKIQAIASTSSRNPPFG